MGDDSGSRLELLFEFGPDLLVSPCGEVHRHHVSGPEVYVEDASVDYLDVVSQIQGFHLFPGFLDEALVYVDPDSLRPELLRRHDHYPAVAAAEVVERLSRLQLRAFEHLPHHAHR